MGILHLWWKRGSKKCFFFSMVDMVTVWILVIITMMMVVMMVSMPGMGHSMSKMIESYASNDVAYVEWIRTPMIPVVRTISDGVMFIIDTLQVIVRIVVVMPACGSSCTVTMSIAGVSHGFGITWWCQSRISWWSCSELNWLVSQARVCRRRTYRSTASN